jgi:hypothetical protein
MLGSMIDSDYQVLHSYKANGAQTCMWFNICRYLGVLNYLLNFGHYQKNLKNIVLSLKINLENSTR